MKYRAADVQPARDYGFFGPDSVSWRVWGHIGSTLMGFSRSVTMEQLDLGLAAATAGTGKIINNPRGRAANTLQYFYTVIAGDSAAATVSSATLVRIHLRFGQGVEPLSGLRYDANSPRSQMWILLCAWHSRLVCYEQFGPGKLSEEDENRYWAECAVFSELQTVDSAAVPRNRAEVELYFQQKRGHAAVSEVSRNAMHHMVDFREIAPPVPRYLLPLEWLLAGVGRAAVISSLPGWARKLGGFRQPRIVGSLATGLCRFLFRRLEKKPAAKLRVIGSIAPTAARVMAPVLFKVPAEREVVLTPGEAFAHYGIDPPAELRAQLSPQEGWTIAPFPPPDGPAGHTPRSEAGPQGLTGVDDGPG
ncbi:oxygenase MpaB family protein [Streptomyces sp. NPDC091272]|uniref:oxygenase MpaB family protein n=1 Tax=Streptomyces sp. NPDC091272 TaxID=3365981 RepID=UPI00381686D0